MSARQCFRCSTVTVHSCNVCGTPYCSNKCKEDDASSHTVFCHKEIGDRHVAILEKVLNLVGINCAGMNWSISEGFYGMNLKNFPFNLDAYGNHMSVWSIHCALCGNNTSGYQQRYRVRYKEATLDYLKCRSCQNQNKKICPATLRCQPRCWNFRGWWTFLACLNKKRIVIPKDIKKIILYLVKVCNH